jgi:hypothetical protein
MTKITEDTPDGEDFTANIEKNESVWLTVGKHSLYIKRTDEGVVVDIFMVGSEDEEAITSTYAFDHE